MEEIISNIMQSPENTNPNVLRGQLQNMGGGSGGGGAVYATFTDKLNQWICDKTFSELKTAYDNHGLIIGVLKHAYNFPSPLLVIMQPHEGEGGNITAFFGCVSFVNYFKGANKMYYLTGSFGIGQDDSVVVDLVFKSGNVS